jgi:hypothetical protein
MPTEVFWRGNLDEGLVRFEAQMHTKLEAIAHYAAADMEAYAKQHAPWKDRTGNARNGLKGEALIVPGKSYGATLSHNVPYGIWLEVRWAGRYAIIGPTIRAESLRVATLLRRLF